MPIAFTCPHCGARTEWADEYAGQSGPCTECDKTIAVPAAVGTDGVPTSWGSSRVRGHLNLITGVGVSMVLATLFFTAFVLPAGRKELCTSNLRCIALAMHTYHDRYDCFPPAYIPDEDGKPMHSWRVLLLPYFCNMPLYEKFNLDEPWDGPNNIRLAKSVYPVYRCPSEASGPGSPETSYVMLVGPGTISDGSTMTTISEITDGTAETIMIVEVANSGIPWTEPRDLDAKELGLGINAPGGAGIRSPHAGGAYVAFCDGHVKYVADSTPPETLQALSTIAGGEDVGDPGKW